MPEGPQKCIDVQNFKFKTASKLRVFRESWDAYNSPLSLVTSASKFGLVFVACPSGFQAIRVNDILQHTSGAEVSNYLCRTIALPSKPTHLAVNCDHALLAVVISHDSCPHALIYQVTQFLSELEIRPLSQVVLGSQPGQAVSELAWNPALPPLLCCCLTDGSLASYEVRGAGALTLTNSLPSANAVCVSWSPRGKQLVIGSRSGTLSQYMPNLTPVKTLPLPPGLNRPAPALAIAWLSSYQFAVVYRVGAVDDNRLSLIVVNAPRQGAMSCVDYDDICYSSGELRPHQFYLSHQQQWNIILCASANAMEVGVLGQVSAQDQFWQQWTLEDSARAELPLEGMTETLPLGMAVDFSSVVPLPWLENTSLPPMPLLLLLSQQGLLSVFHIINLKPDAAQLCSPPEAIPCLQSVFQPNVLRQPSSPPQQQPSPQQPKPTPVAVVDKPLVSAPQATFAPPQPVSFAPPPFTSTPPPVTFVTPQATFSPTPKPTAVMAAPTVTPQRHESAKPAPEAPKEVSKPPEVPKPAKPPGMSEAALAVATRDVKKHFEEELASSLKRSQDVATQVGTPEEASILRVSLETIDKESKNISTKVAEIVDKLQKLQDMTLNTLAWVDEARSGVMQLDFPGYVQVAHLQPLNSASAERHNSIQRRSFYLESQIEQATQLLNQVWADFSESRSKERKLRPPSMHALYQSLLIHRRILAQQKALVERLTHMTSLPFGARASIPLTPIQSSSNIDLSSLAQNLSEVPVKEIKKKTPVLLTLSTNHELLLKKSLQNRPMTRIKQAVVSQPLYVPPIHNSSPETINTVSASNSGRFASLVSKQPPPPVTVIPKSPLSAFGQSFSGPPKPISSTTAAPSFTGSQPGFASVPSPLTTFTQPTTQKQSNSSKSLFGSASIPTSTSNLINGGEPYISPSSTDPAFASLPFGIKIPEVLAASTSTNALLALLAVPPITSQSLPVTSSFGFKTSGLTLPAKVATSAPSTLSSSTVSASTASSLLFASSTQAPSTAPPLSTTFATSTTPSLFGQSNITPSFGSSSQPSPLMSLISASQKTPTTFGQFPSANTISVSLFGKEASPPVTRVLSTPENKTSYSVIASDITPPKEKTTSKVDSSSPTEELAVTPVKEETPKLDVSSNKTTTTPVLTETFISTTSPIVAPSLFNQNVFGQAASSSNSSSFFGQAGSSNLFGQIKAEAVTSSSNDSVSSSNLLFRGSIPVFSPASSTVSTTTATAPVTTAITSVTTTTATATGTFSEAASQATTTVSVSAPTTEVSGDVKTTPVFAQLAQSTASTTTSVFASTASVASTQSMFGQAVQTTTEPSVFNQTSTPTSVFGTAITSAPSFAQPTSTPSTSVFGQAKSATEPLFGQSAAFGQQSSSPSVFGNTAGGASSSPFGSAFGQASSSVFGQASAASPSSNIFGQAASANPAPTAAAPSAFSGGNVFGQSTFAQNTPEKNPDTTSQVTSLFGGMLGSPSSSGSNLFGSSSFSKPAASIFGQPSAGGESSSLFGNTEACSPFGSKTPANKSVFGSTDGSTTPANPFSLTPGNKDTSTSIFGQTSSSAFGSSGGSLFGQAATPGPFSSGAAGGNPFQRSSGNVFGSPVTPSNTAQTSFGGFGGATSPTSPGGFGAPPAFGGAPSFGGSPTFGGGTSRVFGGASPAGASTFGGASVAGGSPFQQNTAFSALASQNTVGFGNLAQQQPVGAPSFGGFGGTQDQNQNNNNNNNNAATGSSFGGNSFSSWR